MLRDDQSGYARLYACSSPNSKQEAHSIIDWCAAFGLLLGIVSYSLTQFRNKTLRCVSKVLKCPHYFTQKNWSCSNGSVERLGGDVLRKTRAISSKLQLPPLRWPSSIPLFQSSIENALSPQRNNGEPVTTFTCLPTPLPILFFRSAKKNQSPLRRLNAEKDQHQINFRKNGCATFTYSVFSPRKPSTGPRDAA